jgi:Leucine-rich repeat (LRR) protein
MKISEFFGKFDDVERALLHPEKVKSLRVVHYPSLIEKAQDFTKFSNLKELYVHSDVTSSGFIPEQIGSLVTLKKLELLNVPFTVFPEWIFRLKNLEYLMLRGHEITNIPNGIAELKKLKVLRLENCALEILPNDLGQLKNLKELSVVDTSVEIEMVVFPQSLKKLRVTYHDKNRLKYNYPNLIIE